MNILLIGPYRQADGWGEACRAYIRALTKSGHSLAIRPIFMGPAVMSEISEDLLELENKRLGYDVIIHNTLPTLFDYRGSGFNIGLSMVETHNLEYTGWVKEFNKMDALWAVSDNDKAILIESGVTVPIDVIPVPVDTNKFEQSYERMPLAEIPDEHFVFYFIGENITRKNLQALVLAYNLEFHPSEPVSLLIKAGRTGQSSEQVNVQLEQEVSKVKSIIRLYPTLEQYKREWILTNRLSETDLYRLHQRCDCFVMPSHGESCCMPMLDAMGFGKPVIVTANTGMDTYINDDSAWRVPSWDSPVLASDPPMPELYTGREVWKTISIPALRTALREAYEDKDLYQSKSSAGIDMVYNFSQENIGILINDSIKKYTK